MMQTYEIGVVRGSASIAESIDVLATYMAEALTAPEEGRVRLAFEGLAFMAGNLCDQLDRLADAAENQPDRAAA